MIDKSHLRQTMLALTEAEMAQAEHTYEQFLMAAKLDRSEPVEIDEQGQATTAANIASAFDDKEHEIRTKIATLNAIDFGKKDRVGPGAAIKVGERYLVVGVSTNAFQCQGKTFIGISPAAPVYEAIEGAKAGDVIEFRGQRLQINDVF